MSPLHLDSILLRTNLRKAEEEIRHSIIKEEALRVSQMSFSLQELYVISQICLLRSSYSFGIAFKAILTRHLVSYQILIKKRQQKQKP